MSYINKYSIKYTNKYLKSFNMSINLKTKYQSEKEERENMIVSEYEKMLEIPGAMRLPIEDVLMKKYAIHSRSTIWLYRKNVAKRLQK